MAQPRQQHLERIRELEQEVAALKAGRDLATRQFENCKRDTEALRASLTLVADEYRATFELANVGIAHVWPDGSWLRVNPFLCDMLGYSEDELLGKRFQDLTYPPDLERDMDLVSAMLSGKVGSYAIEKRYVRKDGKVIWTNLNVSLLRDEAGQAQYFISIIQDIHSRVMALQGLRHSREQLHAVLESLSEGVVVFNTKGRLIEINPAAIKLFGFDGPEDIASQPEELDQLLEVSTLDGVGLPARDWPVMALVAGQEIEPVELRVRRRDSEHTWIGSVSGSVVRNPDGGILLTVLTVRDVSQQKRAETALRASEERLRLAFDNIPDAVIRYDTALRIEAANAAALSLIADGADIVGKRNCDLPGLSCARQWDSLLENALATRQIQADELSHPMKSGIRYLSVSCVPLCEDKGRINEVMVMVHDYTERRRAEEQARHAALHDPLTGLPNRALLFEYAHHIFAAADRSRQRVAVAFIDLDRFKPINDMHGHAVGDMVLHQVACRIQQSVRGEDMVFRLGGDEFLALLPGVHCEQDIDALAQQLGTAISAPYEVDALELSLSASIGVSLYPDHAGDIDALVSHADAAMYHAKQSGRNTTQTYAPAMAERLHGQHRIEQQLRRAFAQQSFSLYYQPLVNLHTREVVSVEALLRLRGSALSPDHFVPVAESTGLIVALGEWAFNEACRQHLSWKEQGLPAIPIAINVSALQFRQRQFSRRLIDSIGDNRLDTAAIQVELTETAVMEDIDHAVAILEQFRRRGIKVSLDDFGTGYSSLSHLSRLPLDKIKVDKSFVRRLETDNASRAVTDSIIALGRALNLEVVAEGIESADELDYLRDRGCDQVQGFYVCKPLPGEAFQSWYRSFDQARAPRSAAPGH